MNKLFSKAMSNRLHNYAMLASLYYVQIMRGLIRSVGDIGTLIRRPDLANDLRDGTAELLVGERLAPRAFDEKLPKLPGIT